MPAKLKEATPTNPVPIYLKVLRTEYIIIEAYNEEDAVAEAREQGLTVVASSEEPLDEGQLN